MIWTHIIYLFILFTLFHHSGRTSAFVSKSPANCVKLAGFQIMHNDISRLMLYGILKCSMHIPITTSAFRI